jgi:hypothetical protein
MIHLSLTHTPHIRTSKHTWFVTLYTDSLCILIVFQKEEQAESNDIYEAIQAWEAREFNCPSSGNWSICV